MGVVVRATVGGFIGTGVMGIGVGVSLGENVPGHVVGADVVFGARGRLFHP